MKHQKKQVIGTITEADYIKAQRKASREEEITLHGKPVSYRRATHKSLKAYDRSKEKRVSFEE